MENDYRVVTTAESSSLGSISDESFVSLKKRRVRCSVPAKTQSTVEDTSHDGLMRALNDAKSAASLMAKVTYMARTRYGIRAQDSHDIFSEAVATYLVVHGRYPPGDNHFGILVGIFHRKALEHLGASKRAGRVVERFVRNLRANRPVVARGEDPEGGVLEHLIRGEDAKVIQAVIESLPVAQREMLLALGEGRSTRLQMVKRLGVNKNTFDSRLSAMRQRLLKELRAMGVSV